MTLNIDKSKEQKRFFLVVPPGLEEAAHFELKQWWLRISGAEMEPKVLGTRGGLEFDCSLEAGLRLNLYLKIPSRILLRLDEFRCRDFPTLHRKIAKINWRRHFESAKITWKVASHQSRVAIKHRIEDACAYGYIDFCKNQPSGKNFFNYVPTVHVRLFDDTCTVSLDASGEHLHRRGYRTMVSEAPLRETAAAGLLWTMLQVARPNGATLVDPMCGSGVIPLEGALLEQPLRLRRFDFEFWRTCPEALKYENRKRLTAPQASETRFGSILGFDVDEQYIKDSMTNAKAAGATERVEFGVCDVFFKHEAKGSNWIVSNPPWDERLEVKDEILESFYSKIFAAVEETYHPELAGFLIPAKVIWEEVKVPATWKPVKKLALELGGSKINFRVFGKVPGPVSIGIAANEKLDGMN